MLKHERLLKKAAEAAKNAYAPYSGFKVGAALLTDKGEVFTGSNVENASYGLSMCAERVAVFKAVSSGSTEFQAIAIYTDTDIPFYPCGACRQVLSEFNPEIKVIIKWNKGHKELNLKELLPYQFKL